MRSLKFGPAQLNILFVQFAAPQPAGGSLTCRWIPDELGVASFAELSTLKVIPVSGYDRRHDVWCINAPLSEGCGSPELVEEIMV